MPRTFAKLKVRRIKPHLCAIRTLHYIISWYQEGLVRYRHAVELKTRRLKDTLFLISDVKTHRDRVGPTNKAQGPIAGTPLLASKRC